MFIRRFVKIVVSVFQESWKHLGAITSRKGPWALSVSIG